MDSAGAGFEAGAVDARLFARGGCGDGGGVGGVVLTRSPLQAELPLTAPKRTLRLGQSCSAWRLNVALFDETKTCLLCTFPVRWMQLR